MFGDRGDNGYNEAVFDASQVVAANMTNVKVITADKVTDNSVAQTMRAMAAAGATIIFATGAGSYSAALAFAQGNPKVVVMQQGGFDENSFPANFGTYWGEAYEPVFLGGMAAGASTKTNKMGFVYAFPTAQTIADIDAFELGAELVNPAAETYLADTANWCDPLKQKSAVSALLADHADVLTYDQECPSTVIAEAKAAGKYVVGYSYNDSSTDPSGWLTGSIWNWSPVYERVITTVEDGSFRGSNYNANWVGSFQNATNPLQIGAFASAVTAATQAKIAAESVILKRPGSSVFKGPVTCQDGSLFTTTGVVPSYAQVNGITCLVKGVIGSLPSP
jgi:basic membrane protein A